MIPTLVLDTVLKEASVHLQVRIQSLHSLTCPRIGLSELSFGEGLSLQ